MSDEIPKKAWARCPACSTVYPNIQIAKDGHKLNCPHDMQLKLQEQGEKIAELEGRILALGGNLDEITSDPGLDFTGVEDDEPDEDEVTTPISQAAYDDLVATTEPATEDDGWDDDEDSLQSVPAVR